MSKFSVMRPAWFLLPLGLFFAAIAPGVWGQVGAGPPAAPPSAARDAATVAPLGEVFLGREVNFGRAAAGAPYNLQQYFSLSEIVHGVRHDRAVVTGDVVSLRGPLDALSAEQFLAAVKGRAVRKLVIQSDRGSLGEAAKVADYVLANRLDVEVDHFCVGACFGVFVAGAKKTLPPASLLGCGDALDGISSAGKHERAELRAAVSHKIASDKTLLDARDAELDRMSAIFAKSGAKDGLIDHCAATAFRTIQASLLTSPLAAADHDAFCAAQDQAWRVKYVRRHDGGIWLPTKSELEAYGVAGVSGENLRPEELARVGAAWRRVRPGYSEAVHEYSEANAKVLQIAAQQAAPPDHAELARRETSGLALIDRLLARTENLLVPEPYAWLTDIVGSASWLYFEPPVACAAPAG